MFGPLLEYMLYVAFSENFLQKSTWSHGIKCKTCSSSASSLGLGIQHVHEHKWGTWHFECVLLPSFFVRNCVCDLKLSEMCGDSQDFLKETKTTPKTHSHLSYRFLVVHVWFCFLVVLLYYSWSWLGIHFILVTVKLPKPRNHKNIYKLKSLYQNKARKTHLVCFFHDVDGLHFGTKEVSPQHSEFGWFFCSQGFTSERRHLGDDHILLIW